MMLLATAVTDPTLHDIYAQSMRSSLFTGFLTLSSFLLATKTLLVIQFRKDVYEREGYLNAHRLQRPDEKPYSSLEQLASLLNTNILLALATSVLQFSIGFIDSLYTTVLCLSFAALTIAITAKSILHIRKNLKNMFSWLDDAAVVEIARLQTKADDAKKAKKRTVTEAKENDLE